MLKFINEEKLSSREVDYWKKVFNANLLFASEVEFESSDRNFSRSDLSRDLNCSGGVYEYGNGIECVKSDGSLRNGAEILTPPRRLYNMLQMVSGYKNLIDKIYTYSPTIHPRAGWHNHISLMHINGVKAQEMPVPGVILKNMLSLVKLYYPSLAYFTSTLPKSECALTRYDSFCLHDELINYDSRDDLSSILGSFSHTRYNCINMNRLETSENKSISRFHIEFRFPDCSLFPVQMACFNITIKALILKAVELSKYGIIDSMISSEEENMFLFKNHFSDEYEDDWNEDNQYDDVQLEYITNEPSTDERISATVTEELMYGIRCKGKELVFLLEDEIKKIDKDSFDLIADLMENPISMKFREMGTSSVQAINEMYEEKLDEMYEQDDESLEEITKLISLGMIRNAKSIGAWKERLVELASCKEDIDSVLSKINKIRPLDYSKELGYFFK